MMSRGRLRVRAASMTVAIAAAWLAVAAAPAAAQGEPGIPQPDGSHPPLQLVDETRTGDRFRELTFATPYLDAPTKVRVLVPAGYETTQRRYPVLYLLHGCCDDWRSWTDKGAAEAITEQYQMIVVMPDAGSDGWYSDWYNGGARGNPRWESYHIGQLIPWIDGHLRTRAARDGRAIAGLSMGGFGTMSYAARHPDLFAAAASFSGATDSNDPAPVGFAAAGEGPWGPRLGNEMRWHAHNPTDLASNLRGLNLQIRTANGTPGGPYDVYGPALLAQDAIEVLCHRQSTNLHNALTGLGIEHVWQDFGPGAHDWPYWQHYLKLSLPAIQDTFDAAPAPPSPFGFRAAEPSFSVHGWDVRMGRETLEFLELADVSPAGLTLTGTGTGTITTPRAYKRGRVYEVRSDSGTTRVRAGSNRRLVIPVDLGAETTTARLRIVPRSQARQVR